MGVLSESVGLVFKMKADGASETSAVIKKTSAEITKEAKDLAKQQAASAKEAEESYKQLTSTMASVGTVIGTLVATAAAGAAAMYALAKATAEFGSEIFDASEKTRIGAETLSALKVAAEQSGASFDQLTGGITKFTKLIGDAANGSEEARAKLVRLGIDPQAAMQDLEGALAQVVAKIASIENPTLQVNAAIDAFGRSGAELLPTIRSFNGDLPKLRDEMRKLGLTITDEAAAAADKFGDSLDTLKAQAAGVGRQFGNELLPIMTEGFGALSVILAENKGVLASWGEGVARQFRIAELASKTFLSYLVQMQNTFALFFSNDSLPDIFRKGAELIQRANAEREQLAQDFDFATGGAGASAGGRIISSSAISNAETIRRAATGGFDKSAADKAEQDRLDDLKAQEDARIAQLRNNVELLQAQAELQKETLDAGLTELQQKEQIRSIDLAIFQARRNLLNDLLQTSNALSLRELNEIEHQKKMLDIEEARYKAKAENNLVELRRLEILESQVKAEQARLDAFLKQSQIPSGAPQQLDVLQRDQSGAEPIDQGSIFDGWRESWGQYVSDIESKSVGIKNIFTELSSIGISAFEGIAQAIGNVVQNYVLYGETGPAVLRKVLASALASIAAEAAVRAIYATGLGFYHLATFNFPAAASAFTAAAVWGGIAAGSALAGRAIAGDSFKKQANTNFTSSQIGSNNTSRSVSDTTNLMSESRINRQEQRITLEVMSRDSHIVKVVGDNLNNRGDLHPVVVKLVEAN